MPTLSSARTSACCPPARPGLSLRIAQRFAAWRQRRRLARLDAAQLDDIGISAEQARTEARRGLWSAPDHWHR